MPDIDGHAVYRVLKADGTTRHIPVVIIMGLSEREANIRTIEAGADAFIVKPFEPVLLAARIQELIEKLSVLEEASPT